MFELAQARRKRLRTEIIARAAKGGVVLEPHDIRFIDGEPTLDGMPADQWLDAMTME